MLMQKDLEIRNLGPAEHTSPLKLSTVHGDGIVNFVPDQARCRYQVEYIPGTEERNDLSFELAGPRKNLAFDPSKVTAAIVTCGGLSPGLNSVIRSVFLQLYHHYGARDVLGIRYGYSGLDPRSAHPPLQMTPEMVDNIHLDGGTMLGSSRGPIAADTAVDFMVDRGVNMLFTIGGDGTQTGAHRINEEIIRRNEKIAIIGIPKTIDNDICYVYRTFGYATAVDKAQEAITCAHTESRVAPNCVAVVKLMGRDAGFIAAGATVASQDVNFCLVPEVPFKLEGKKGLLELLKHRILSRDHAVIVVAEGAGQDLFAAQTDSCDASGNKRYSDIGTYLSAQIKQYFADQQIELNLKYIDPSYTIRSVAPNSHDQVLCDMFARNAVHAGMAGKTDMLVGLWHGMAIHVPIPAAVGVKKTMSTESSLWMSVLDTTGQPAVIG